VTIALLAVVFVVAAFWLLYREPPKQRPGEALGKFDRVAQRIHDVVQGRWYGKMAATVVVLAAGIAVAQVFSSDTLTASTSTQTVTTRQTVTVTVSTPVDPSSTVPATTTTPAPDANHSVIGTWSGIVVDQDDKASKFRLSVIVKTTRVDVETVGSVTLDGGECFFTLTSAGPQANAFLFSSNGSTTDTKSNCSSTINLSLERKTDDTVVVTTDYGGDDVGTLHRG
jgi:hypothetical protein